MKSKRSPTSREAPSSAAKAPERHEASSNSLLASQLVEEPTEESGLLAEEALPGGVRAEAEAAYGTSLGDVRLVESDDPAGDGDRTVKAVAEGRTIRALPGISDDILMHELAHMAQAGPSGLPARATVKRGPAEEDADRMVLASRLGSKVAPKASVAAPHAFSTPAHIAMGDEAEGGPDVVNVNGAKFTMGELDAIPDFVRDVDTLYSMRKGDLEKLQELLERDRETPGSVSTEEWQKVTNGAYLDIAKHNEDHFAASDPEIAPPTGGPNNQDTWERYYRAAFAEAALAHGNEAADHTSRAWVNMGFAEHYLEDAYSAGHQFNKADASAQASATLAGRPKETNDAVLKRVADIVWAEKGDFIGANYEAMWGAGWMTFDQVVFEEFVRRAVEKDEGYLTNGLALAAHDDLGSKPMRGRLGDGSGPIPMAGDNTSTKETRAVVVDAVTVARDPLRRALAGEEIDIDATVQQVRLMFPRPEASANVPERVAAHYEDDSARIESLVDSLSNHIVSVMEGACVEVPDQVRRKAGAVVGADPAVGELELDPKAATVGEWYVVKPGDTLWDIAVAHYGSDNEWHAIYDANKDRLPSPFDPKHLQPNWKLWLPAASEAR